MSAPVAAGSGGALGVISAADAVDGNRPQSPPSHWEANARVVTAFPRLTQDLDAEVVVVGGGYTGLAAAGELLRSGTACVLLEAADAGWGASGRNGGFAVPRYKKGYSLLARKLGDAETRRLYRWVLEAVDRIEATVEEFRIDCAFERRGHLTAAHSRDALAALTADAEWLRRVADDAAPRLLDRAATREAMGSALYCGGYYDPRGATVHPLDFARGHAAALAARGVPVFAASPVTRVVEEGERVVAETPGGRVRARQAIIATNAYTPPGMVGTLDRRIVPVCTSVVTTAALPGSLRENVLPAGWPVSDTKHLIHYFRRTPAGGFLFGGRGDITGRRDDPEIYRGLEAALVALYPALAGVPIAQRWSGMVAVTLDDFPHVGRMSERVVAALGYGGRGVALAGLLGTFAARLARGERFDAGVFSFSAFRPIPLHGLRIPGMRAIAAWYGWRDRRALAGSAV